MKQKLSIFDVDGTLAEGFYAEKFVKALYKAGKISKKELGNIEEIIQAYKTGIYSYDQFAREGLRAFGRGVKGEKEEDLKNVGKKYVQDNLQDKFSFTSGLIKMIRDRKYRIITISATPREIILPFSKSLGITETFATTYEIDNGVYTGELVLNCALAETKMTITKKCATQNGINLDISTGFGDSESDLGFLEIVGFPVAIKPTPQLEGVAKEKGWLICKDDNQILKSVSSYLS